MSAIKKFFSTRTPKFNFMQRVMQDRPFTLLDLGAGNHSPSKTTNIFPNCTYHGVDLNYDYEYTPADIEALKKFYEMDLTKLEFDEMPDDFYDYINMAHIIEHLHNGDVVVEKIATKLKKGGYIYIEYPGKRSTTLPSMYGTLNFYDDPTHVRVYSVKELSQLLKKSGFEVLSSGTRRSWYYIFLIPFTSMAYMLKGKRIPAAVLWDLMGFAEYVFARKKI